MRSMKIIDMERVRESELCNHFRHRATYNATSTFSIYFDISLNSALRHTHGRLKVGEHVPNHSASRDGKSFVLNYPREDNRALSNRNAYGMSQQL